MLLVVTTLSLFCLAAGVQGQSARNTSACLNMACNSSMLLQCSADQGIFITKMLYGVKPKDSACSAAPSCNTCCQPDVSDCFGDYGMQHFQSAYEACWNTQSCTNQTYSGRPLCALGIDSTFSVVEYICLQAGLVTEFHTNTSITAPAVAVLYDPSKWGSYPVVRGDNQTWHCQVYTDDCVQRQADVTLVKKSYIGDPSNCSSVGWSGGPFLPCVKDFQYQRITATTPFYVSVMVDGNYRFPSGWAVVKATDGSNLAVKCGYTDSSLRSTSDCRGTTTRESSTPGKPSTTAPMSPTTPKVTASKITVSSSPDVASSTSPDVTMSMTTTSSRDVTVAKVTTPKSMSSSSATGTERPEGEGSRGVLLGVAITGWILVTVLAVLLCISVIFLIRLRRRGTSSDNTQVGVASTQVIHMERTTHRSQYSDNTDSSSSRPAEYVNAASGRTPSSHAEPRRDNEQEYSPLDWSRDQVNPYMGLRKA